MKGDKNFILAVKSRKVIFDDVDIVISNYIHIKISIENAAKNFIFFGRKFKLSKLSNILLRYVERCFSSIPDSQNFSNLDFVSFANILLGNNLNVDSELQVFKAAYAWLSHNISERSKYSKDVMLTVRHFLLSDLKNILSKNCYLKIMTNALQE